ncbi:hypothetical protein ADIWIN_0127 [Winogradskyella psychrotolerans RS-3]|uniref:O-antigen ligase-related domain-containing protein n=1 Tax=Winogradskyella psychrotolerans RS-3 TaxID=641526 RepID=S7XFK7_9FLAO|nr:O-antigen ligase family protein [Winogradskyella psychrotolerans]EPR74763.1 hypothetical protein ADIWIN_0127 [Winogradskyella psychrotolerans RS-3]
MLFSPKFVALVIALLAFNNVLIVTPITPPSLYYGFMAFTVFLAIINSKHKIDYLTLTLVFICLLSIQFNTIPVFFKPYNRFIVFVIALLVLSPLFYGDYINQVKHYCFKYTNHLIVWLTLLSFVGRVSGVYSGIDNGSNFGGFTINSMTLSPLAGISLLLCVFNLKYKDLKKKQNLFYKFMIVVSFLTLLLSASRIAIVSAVIALLFLSIQLYKKRLGTLIRVLLGICLLSILSFPLWSQYTENLIEKTEKRAADGDEFGSREELWAYRLDEFKESPVIGIGYSNALYGTINYDTGTVEPGTSWGVILAMTGILGIGIFVFLVLRTFIRNSKIAKFKSQLSLNHFLNTLLVFL